MAVLGFAFLLLCMTISMIGSEFQPSSVASILDSIRAVKQEVKDLKESIQADNEQTLIYILDKIAALQKEFRGLLSNLSSRVEQLEDDVAQVNQTLLVEKLRQQLEDIQSFMTCAGEPPSPQNGRPVDLERRHSSEVRYRCDVNFDLTGDSTVRCHFGKWEGRPPLCTRPALSLRVHSEEYRSRWPVINVSCSDEENGQHVQFSRFLDTGTGWALPTGARTYSRGRVAVLDLSGVPRSDKRGVFQCRQSNRTGMAFLIDPNGRFVRSKVASVGDTVELSIYADAPTLRWLHDGQRVTAWDGRGKVEIAGVGEEDAGVYEQYEEGDRRGFQVFFRLVVRGCPVGFFGQRCEENCSACQNGGLCQEELGTCACPVGFKGTYCEDACGQGRFGQDCSQECAGGDCIRQLFCLQDPYGCSCAAGYFGDNCHYRCWRGYFGADCGQTCRCKEGPCDPYTGACSGGCSEGWTGVSCQIPVGE